MASPITQVTELFKRVTGRKTPTPAPAPKPEAAKPDPVAKIVS